MSTNKNIIKKRDLYFRNILKLFETGIPTLTNKHGQSNSYLEK